MSPESLPFEKLRTLLQGMQPWQASSQQVQQLQEIMRQSQALQEREQALLQQWQSQLQELQELMKQAHECLPYNAKKASDLFRKGLDKAEVCYKTQDDLLHHQEEGLQQQEKFLRLQRSQLPLDAAETKAGLLWGLGQARSLLGDFEEVKETLEQAVTLLAEQPSPLKPMLRQALGDACFKQQLFPKAMEYYQQAADEFVTFGLWEMVAQARSSAADCALGQGDRADFWSNLQDAIRVAETHNLTETDLMGQLRLKESWFRLQADVDGEFAQDLKEKRTQDKPVVEGIISLVDLELFEAECLAKSNAPGKAEKYLQHAYELAKDLPDKQSSAQRKLADLCEEQERIPEAIHHAEEALGIARQCGASAMIQLGLVQLIPLRVKSGDTGQRKRAAQEMDELRAMGAGDGLATALLARALVYWGEKQFAPALVDIEEAVRCARAPDQQRIALIAKTATLRDLGRKEEALTANLEAIALLDRERAEKGETSLTEWRDLLSQTAVLHESAALLLAELNRIRESFEHAEKGKALRLRHQLAQAEIGEVPGADVDELQASLSRESSGMAMFCVGAQRTLLLIIDPREQEPKYDFIELAEKELKEILPGDALSGEQESERLFNALPGLSKLLTLQLREIARHCGEKGGVLYLVPDSRLFFVPFAALRCEDDTPLIQHCALAYAPSASVLQWCRSRGSRQAARTCLAIGVGKAEDEQKPDILFAEYARAIAALGWADYLPLLDSEATPEKFLDAAQHFAVLHLSCHGSVETGVLGTLSASQLHFADDRRLTAKEIFELNGRLHAELAFLNACMSGGFRLRVGSEVGGFWEAFLQAGVPSLIATLAYVHPVYAQQIALDFYQEWLTGGVTKAEALRRAQLHLHKQNLDPRHWASHMLIGDHR